MDKRSYPAGWIPTALSILVGLTLAGGAASATAPDWVPRTGFVSLQFDDGTHLDYASVYTLLQNHGFKGTFGVITENSPLGTEGNPAKLQVMYRSGHEIQDHTTRHDHMWATHVDTLDDGTCDWIEYTFGNLAMWDSLCDRSQFILDSLGVEVTGWNHPGGAGPGTIPGHWNWSWRGFENDSLFQLIGNRFWYAVCMGVWENTAHLNLRGHNFPDRFPFFNVPHRTIDAVPLAQIQQEIADAVASGLWYPSVAHVKSAEMVYKVTDLVEWLDEKDIEVIRVKEAVERVYYGNPDPFSNQLPQARMLDDLDGNGRPDGFMGDCVLDTLTASPVDSSYCARIFGTCDTFCYGPEVGTGCFSVWARGPAGAQIKISYQVIDFDWQVIDSHSSGWISLGDTWTLLDAGTDPMFDIPVCDEADRIRFFVISSQGDTVTIAHPEFLLGPEAGITTWEVPPGGLIYPNPVVCGCMLHSPCGCFEVFDVAGRSVSVDCRVEAGGACEISTGGLAAGMYLFVPCRLHRGAIKVIVLP